MTFYLLATWVRLILNEDNKDVPYVLCQTNNNQLIYNVV